MKPVGFLLKAIAFVALGIAVVIIGNIAHDQYRQYQEIGNHYQGHYHLFNIIAVYFMAGVLALAAICVLFFMIEDLIVEDEDEDEPETSPCRGHTSESPFGSGIPPFPIELLILLDIIQMEEERAEEAREKRRKAAEKDEPSASDRQH